MKRRQLLSYMLGHAALIPALTALPTGSLMAASFTLPEFDRLDRSDDEWQALLPPERFYILFEEGTERPFSSPLNDEKREGVFICAACHLPLFLSEHKYDSGTGWPSFTQPIAKAMGKKRDFKMILPRTEYHCARCGGHQGHVFNDGPRPRRERWCNNGLALLFVPAGTTLPALRS
ncbi:MAG: peptide-methionine (R)-S-oxide reductase MsrB [Proteobacteria bacterium]|jgi:peptide-methionine (R)-S-oxide reductase|nr:peptide-methionine (R)-S-oxide reductase MsrB [Pseudomonadota bacterium]